MSSIWYDSIRVVEGPDRKKVHINVFYPYIPPTSADVYVITVRGDRYDLLASNYYGDVSLWRLIPRANNLVCDSLYPPVGIQLRIPANAQTLVQEYKSLNSR
jgi:hypothetical protein